MKKKHIKPLSLALGIVFLLFILTNFGLNFWLKNKLPDYLKNNSDYVVTYSQLDVHLGTGNIFATGLTVNNKDPQNQNVIGLQGTVDTVSVSRFGIIDAVFRKRISTSDLLLKNPNLNITLQKPQKKKNGKKQNPIVLDNIFITNGQINIYRHTRQKFLSVNDLNLSVENLQMTEESVERKLPVVFDKYDVRGKNFYFRLDNVYAFTAKKISTKDQQMSITEFEMHPLLTFAQFRQFYPKKRTLFDFSAREMKFSDILLKNNKITLTEVRFDDPDLKMYTTDVKQNAEEQSFTYDLDLQDLFLNHAKIKILKPDGSTKFAAADLTMSINKLVMNEETAEGNIPFDYQTFKIAGSGLNFITKKENITIGAIAANPNSVDIRNFAVRPYGNSANSAKVNLTTPQIRLLINDWKFTDNKLNLDAKDVIVRNLRGTISAPQQTSKQKGNYSGIHFPLKIKNIQLLNSDISYVKAGQPLAFKGLNITLNDLFMDENTVKKGLPFDIGSYKMDSRSYNYSTKFYQISGSQLKFNANSFQTLSFAMKPRVSRAQFIRMIPTERDLYDISAANISAKGSWDLFSDQQKIHASHMTLDGVNANIFRSKVPTDDPTHKPMYSALLRKIKFPMVTDHLYIKNSVLVYEEDTKKSEGPGKLTFANFNLHAQNLNSGKTAGKSTNIPISVQCRFLNASPMNVQWNLDTGSMNDAFTIAGTISDLNAERINAFIEPYLKARATGNIDELKFDFRGTRAGLDGNVKMKHKELKVELLNETGDKRKVLSAVVNIFVKSNSGSLPESVVVDGVKRDPTKSFFNLFWKGIEEGLKKTLIGKNIEATQQTVENTVTDTKSTVKDVKSKVQDAKTNVKGTIDQTKDKIKTATEKEPEKGNFLQRVFRKKEKKED